LAERWHGEGLRRLARVKLEPEVKFSHYGAFFRISSCGCISDTNENIFTKFGGYVANGVPQRAELSKWASFKRHMQGGGYLGLVKAA